MITWLRNLFNRPAGLDSAGLDSAGLDSAGLDSEDDVGDDPGLAQSRATGGRATQAGDSGTTTGTGTNDEFVGRTAGQDEGYAGTTGAEARQQEGPS